jgi:protein TonB
VFAVALGLVIVFTLKLRESAQRLANQPQRITLVEEAPPPPPRKDEPPPQKLEEKMEIEPAEAIEEVVEDEPPPVSETLGLDADADAGGSDSFGLAAKRGGTDIVKLAHLEASGSGTGKGTVKPEWTSYAGSLRSQLERALSNHDGLRRRNYSVALRVWIEEDGRVQRCELVQTSGDASVDALIQSALTRAGTTMGPPPKDMPRLLRFRLTSRGAG